MFLWGAFPFLRFALAFITGIVVQSHYPEFWNSGNLTWTSVGLISFFAILNTIKGSDSLRFVQGFFGLLFLVYLGGVTSKLNNDLQRTNHYTQFGKVIAFEARILSEASERKDYFRYEAEVLSLMVDSGSYSSNGKIHFYQRKEENNVPIHYGDHVMIRGGILPIYPPGNPHEFDYGAYLSKQNIYGHAFLSDKDLKVVGSQSPNILLAYALVLRGKCLSIIHACVSEPREQAILAALLLGVKDYLDTDIKEAYSSAGAMHVLAVSGLHVGIVFYLLGIIFGFLKKTIKGRILFVVLSLFCIWSYALITGFSASVMRAAVMFSVILISGNLGRYAHIYNSLGIAALVLLLFDPMLIYSVGFQLSFAAVFGIVYLHPRIFRLLEPETKMVNYIWSITCVSVAAQVATFPLTMLYFHQFPTYFLVSNLVVIPAASLMLVGGIILIFVGAFWLSMGQLLGVAVSFLVWFVNEAMMLVVRLPYPLFDWLYFDLIDTTLVYLILVFLAIAFAIRSRAAFVFSGVLVVIWGLVAVKNDYIKEINQQLIIYEIKNHTAIDVIEGSTAHLLIDTLMVDEEELLEFQINPNRLAGGLNPIKSSMIPFRSTSQMKPVDGGFMMVWKGRRIFILEQKSSVNFHQLTSNDLVVLNTDRFSDFGEAKVIIGSKMPFYKQKRLKNQLSDSHSLTLDGAYTLKNNRTISGI